MKCPNCNETLLITERKSVEIDYCPSCRGVWLDKGELDKIIAFSNEGPHQHTQPHPENTHKPEYRENTNWKKYDDDDDDDDYKRKDYNKSGPKKKSSFLGDLFDF
jgi:uncharacterized protein